MWGFPQFSVADKSRQFRNYINASFSFNVVNYVHSEYIYEYKPCLPP